MKSSSGPGCDSGIGTLSRIPWGSHFCNFYRAQSDLAECVVPFFQKAFVDNEMGIWITSDPLKTLFSEYEAKLTHHDFALVRNEKGWQRIESSTLAWSGRLV